MEKSASKVAAGIAEVMEMNQKAMAPRGQKRPTVHQLDVPVVLTICHSAVESFHGYIKEHLEKNNYFYLV